MEQKNINWIVFAGIIVIAALFILPKLGLFSIFPVGTVGDLSVKYQRMDGNCIVRVERNGVTTWVGPYDFDGMGQHNLETAIGIGWVDENTSQGFLGILQTYYPDESCNPVLYQNGNENGEEFDELDINQDGKVDRSELGVAINKWISGEISRETLHEAISIWRENL